MVTAFASLLGALVGAWIGTRQKQVYKDILPALTASVEPVIRRAYPKGGKRKPKIQDDLAAWKVEQEKN